MTSTDNDPQHPLERIAGLTRQIIGKVKELRDGFPAQMSYVPNMGHSVLEIERACEEVLMACDSNFLDSHISPLIREKLEMVPSDGFFFYERYTTSRSALCGWISTVVQMRCCTLPAGTAVHVVLLDLVPLPSKGKQDVVKEIFVATKEELERMDRLDSCGRPVAEGKDGYKDRVVLATFNAP